MTEGEIKYPNAQEEGVTPEIDQARKLGIFTPMSEDMTWLSSKAESELKANNEQVASEQEQPDYLIAKEKDDVGNLQDPHVRENLESKYAIDRGLVEARRLREVNNAMEKEIAGMLLGHDIEQFRTPNQAQLLAIRETLNVAYQQDPQINDRPQAKERIREIIALEKQLSELLVTFGQEVQDIASSR
ncbi:MAG: hypothetical protein WC857_03815 [Candidatus Paceibacterota bacterium]|jgi:hypothetical protein